MRNIYMWKWPASVMYMYLYSVMYSVMHLDHIYSIIWFTWQNFAGDVMDRNYDVIIFIWKYLYFKKV